jgi:hypothetical protein
MNIEGAVEEDFKKKKIALGLRVLHNVGENVVWTKTKLLISTWWRAGRFGASLGGLL